MGKLWFNNFALGPTDLYNDKKLSNNNFSMTPLHAWLEFRATETLTKCWRKVQITAHQNHFSQFSERQAQLLLTSNSKRRTTRNKYTQSGLIRNDAQSH